MTATVADPRSVVRLVACPQCSDRRRVLVESAAGLRGHCFNCGRRLDAPLATESMAPARVLQGLPARGDRALIA
jgi:hypothetical protein